ncbi:hypothetical protein PIB30_082861 [Stylosanthes scabra]|uniref:Uncharacterized protein n=1 Tax=Stylosanthes scabra TaxID=79078 RepID=A0ABU6YQX7_9FABA|nr:hypothetical protein [Stylosanthes scabra]
MGHQNVRGMTMVVTFGAWLAPSSNVTWVMVWSWESDLAWPSLNVTWWAHKLDMGASNVTCFALPSFKCFLTLWRAVVAVFVITKWGGASAPSGSCGRATNGKLPHQERRARARHAKGAAARSGLIWDFGFLSILLAFLVLLSFAWALSLHFRPEIH